MKIWASLLFVVIALTGCAVPKQPKIPLVSIFDKDQAEKLMSEGNNTVKGSALMRQVSGGVVSCAGQAVQLIPATAYANERMRVIYGNDVSGMTNAMNLQVNPDPFTYTEPEYFRLVKGTQCDAQGFFKFEKIADGEFFVLTRITWKANPNSLFFEGGAMMRKIKIQGGEVKELVIAP